MNPITLMEWAYGAEAPDSYYTVRKAGDRWAAVVVYGISCFRSKQPVWSFSDRDEAISAAKEMAADHGLPFKMEGAA